VKTRGAPLSLHCHMDVTAYLESFSATLALLGPALEPAAGAGDAMVRLKRAQVLHNVLTAKAPAVKAADLKTMTAEWVQGMMESTFPVESAVVDAEFPESQSDQLHAILAALEGAHGAMGRLVDLYRSLGELDEPPAPAEPRASSGGTPGGSGSGEGRDRPTAGEASSSADPADRPRRPPEVEQAAGVLRSALQSGAVLEDALPAGAAAQARVFGADLWEALCWRRGALRFYMVSTAIKKWREDDSAAPATDPPEGAAAAAAHRSEEEASSGGADEGGGAPALPAPAAVSPAALRAGAAASPSVGLLEEAYDALATLLESRRDTTATRGDDGGPTALRYGIYSSTHLLALAFQGELAYWRWAATLRAPRAADDDGLGDLWYRRAAVAVHRYLHTVDVIMEGCGWSTTRQRELLDILSYGRDDSLAAALDGEIGVLERQMAALNAQDRKGFATAAQARTSSTPRGKAKGKGGKKR
jgi:hypothetical protein